MKRKLISLFLAILFVFGSIPAFAEDASPENVYLRQLPQNTYINTALIPEECYPMVCISPYASYSLYESYRKDPWFILFNLPEGAIATEFDTDACHLVDMDSQIQYSYQATDDYSYESFLNKCENDEYIIFDGEGKKAAYIDPEGKRAYGLIGVPEITKGAKLYISIYMDGINRNVSTEKRVPLLTEAIQNEVNRVQGEMVVKLMDHYWTYGNYSGVKMLSFEYSDLMLSIDFPELACNFKDGSTVTARMFATKLDGYDLTGYFDFGSNSSIKAEISMETYSYVPYKKSEDPSQVQTVTLSDGSEFEVYMNTLSDGSASLVYSSFLISDNAGYSSDQNYYLNINLDGENIRWNSIDDVAADLDIIVQSMRFIDPDKDPYQPAAIPAALSDLKNEIQGTAPAGKEDAPASEVKDGSWVCDSCQAVNNGKFCTNCGSPKPDNGPWVCPNCSSENTGNFCSNCGTPKP